MEMFQLKIMSKISPEQIDALLPQTQCGLCGYNGCMPYAEAIVLAKAPINLCPPGGVKTLQQLGALLNQDPNPFIPEMQRTTKPKMQAVIREDECIGCTKCMEACPVDAILGSAKQMHTVIASVCTGCELCIAPCPVDCIDMLALTREQSDEEQIQQAHAARNRYQARTKRLTIEKITKKKKLQMSSLEKKKKYIEEAKARVRAKQAGLVSG